MILFSFSFKPQLYFTLFNHPLSQVTTNHTTLKLTISRKGKAKTRGFKGEERKNVGLTVGHFTLPPLNLLFPINHYRSS